LEKKRKWGEIKSLLSVGRRVVVFHGREKIASRRANNWGRA